MKRFLPRRKLSSLLSLLGLSGLCGTVSAAEPFQWSHWWLPPMHSEHGEGIDNLFVFIFWITVVALILVQAVLVWFLIKYRQRTDAPRPHFIHGNTRLEMAWTLAPAVILAVLALFSKQVWSGYRYGQALDPDLVQIMVVGEQFKWNVIYPGKDNQVGDYLRYPKVHDANWPHYRRYKQVNGPRELPRAQAVRAINDYIADENPLGKYYPNPKSENAKTYKGVDDDWQKDPTRPVVAPLNRTVEVLLGAKDVLHSFSVPEFRVKLDAVPGMIGRIYFKATKPSVEEIAVDDLQLNTRFWVDRTMAYAVTDEENYSTVADPKSKDVMAGSMQTAGQTFIPARLAARGVENPTPQQMQEELQQLRNDFKAAGVNRIWAITHGYEIVCQELCGSGHGTMRGELFVLTPEQYQNHLNKNAPAETAPPKKEETVALK